MQIEKSMIDGDDLDRLMKEKENSDRIISELKQTLETSKRSYEEHLQQQEARAGYSQMELQQKLSEAESLLLESRKRRKEIEADSESRYQNWNKKEHFFRNFINSHLRSVQVLHTFS